MRTNLKLFLALFPLVLLSACVSMPDGPSVMALPGTGKSFDQFRYDDGSCRQYALEQVGGRTANQAANESMAKSAAVGTAIGAVAGAAAGGGRGAGVGAAAGLVAGGAVGVNAADTSSYGTQRRYDHAYIQCMYAKGHRVPVWGRAIEQQPRHTPPPPPPGYVPPAP